MDFTITVFQFEKLEAELIDTHQVAVTLTPGSTTAGTMATIDGKVAADFSFDGATLTLTVNLTKHVGYLKFIAEAGLKSKINAAIKALPA
jgi:hypothetical protein